LNLNPAQATFAEIFEWIDDIFVGSWSHTTYYSPKNPKNEKTMKMTKILLFDKKIANIGKNTKTIKIKKSKQINTQSNSLKQKTT